MAGLGGLRMIDSPSTAMEVGRRASMTERLAEERQQLIDRLAEIDNVLDLLKSNPAVQTCIDALTKLNRF